jgi:acyl carrier protein
MSIQNVASTLETCMPFASSDVRALIATCLGVDVKRVTDEAHIREDLGARWLDRLELMIRIEDRFQGVELTDADMDHIDVVSDLIRHIESLCVNSPRQLARSGLARKAA